MYCSGRTTLYNRQLKISAFGRYVVVQDDDDGDDVDEESPRTAIEWRAVNKTKQGSQLKSIKHY